MKITRSVLTDENGRLMERSVQLGPKDPPWRNLTREEDDMTASRPASFLYPRDGSPIVQLKEVRLVVSTSRFIANGTDEFSVAIRGMEPPETCGVLINTTRYVLDSDDLVIIRTETPGIYTVSLDDTAHWAEVDLYSVMAISQ